ncbi:MAG: transcription initiation factor IIB family protein, partial [Candidatus Nanohaloarchaea archaeon]
MEAFAEADVTAVEDEMDVCPECGSSNIEKQDSGSVCQDCGHEFDGGTSSSGSGTSQFESGGTRSQSRPSYSGIEKWQQSRSEESTFELSQLNRIISQLELPRDVHERVTELVEKAKDKGLMRGRDMSEMLSALIYIVAREEGTPRTLDEISEVTGVGKRRIGKSYRYIGREMDMRVVPPQPEDHIKRFADKLDLSEDVRDRSRGIIDQAKEKEILAGKAPTGIAASALYIASNIEGEKRTQKEVAEMLNVTEVTVRNRSKELVEELGLEDEF